MMNERQAQEVAQAIRLKSRTWMEDDLYGAFLRANIFGGLPLTVRVVPVEQGDGFVVSAQWKHLEECFATREEWEAFATKMEERMEMAAFGARGESGFGEFLNGSGVQ